MTKQTTSSVQILLKEDLVSRLVGLGLTSHPAKVLLALLENPGIPASKICSITNIPDSKIYQALEDLDRKWNLIEVRKGNPSIYRALNPEQIILKLKQVAENEHTDRLQTLEKLKKRIEPLAKNNLEPSEIEIAYIVKGQQNILQRLKNTIEQAEKMIQLLTFQEDILGPLLPSLVEAKRRGVKMKLAVTLELKKELDSFVSVKNLACKCNLLLIDNSKLVSISNWGSDKSHALVTEDEVMTTIARDYYDNPKCCS